jgi:hypothetical protein
MTPKNLEVVISRRRLGRRHVTFRNGNMQNDTLDTLASLWHCFHGTIVPLSPESPMYTATSNSVADRGPSNFCPQLRTCI